MMARVFFYLIAGLLDHITCTYYVPNACHRNDVYPTSGFAPSCLYLCISGGEVQERHYADGTYCFEKYSGDDEAVRYLGFCKYGVCLPANKEPSGKLPHQWDGIYHVCDDKTSVYGTVRNCTFICVRQVKPYFPREYYYGVYFDTRCMLQDGKVGLCRSGFCYGMEYFQSTVKPQKPVAPEKPTTPQRPGIPQWTVKPQRPVIPPSPVVPQKPQMPQIPQRPGIPQWTVKPQRPVIPPSPVVPQKPQMPQIPQISQIPQIPQMSVVPQMPVKPQRTLKSPPSKNVPQQNIIH